MQRKRSSNRNGLYRDAAGQWCIDLTIGGKRVRRTLQTQDRVEAEEAAHHLRTALWRERKLGERPAYTWDDAVRAWVDDAQRRRLKSIMDGIEKLTWLHPHLQGIKLSELTKEKIKDVLKKKADERDPRDPKWRPAGGTVNRYYSQISRVLQFALAENMVGAIPKLTKKDLWPENDSRFKWLKPEEAARLLKELEGPRTVHLHRMVRWSLATGVRMANTIGLEWENVDMARRTSWVWNDETKNKQRFAIPLNDDAMAVLRECVGDHKKFVFTYQGEPVQDANCDGFQHALKRAKLAIRWHDLRHTWATWHVQRGTPLEVLQKLGGWKDFKMVLRYSHLSTSYISEYAANSSFSQDAGRNRSEAPHTPLTKMPKTLITKSETESPRLQRPAL